MHNSITLSHIHQARQRISKFVLQTPLVASEKLAAQMQMDIRFKAENLQHIGAFKARGATNAVLSLTDVEASRGVVTHSSGNHAAAVARAAYQRQIQAYIVMPHNSARSKIENVRAFGFEPHFCETDSVSRTAAADALVASTGGTLIHPFDNALVIAGQGTVGLEILEQWSDVEVVLAPVGGGGLLSGLLIAIKEQRPEVQVIAVEPALADDAARSLQAGQIQPPLRYDTVADGLRSCLGELTFPILQRYVDDILLVSDEEIIDAMRLLAQKVHLMVEPSGAVSLAGAMQSAPRLQGKRVCCVLSGGNLDFGHLPTDWHLL